jgi:hypothetical protein
MLKNYGLVLVVSLWITLRRCQCQMVGLYRNDELENIWKELVVLLVRNFPQETGESHECLSQVSCSLDRNSNRGPPGNECRVLPLCQLAQFLDVYLHTERGECQMLLTAICLGSGLQRHRALLLQSSSRYGMSTVTLKPFRAQWLRYVPHTLAFRISAFCS